MDEREYSNEQVEQILHAYRSIFPTISGELANYWGLQRERHWSYLTTDFHTASFQKLQSLHHRTLEIDALGLGVKERGDALREASLKLGIGFSIGISPWTDNLLERTYSDTKNSAVILLGHDWYPIVISDRPSGAPLKASDSIHAVQKYWPTVPEAVLDGTKVGLFFNLYPDYRPPGDPKCGNITKDEYRGMRTFSWTELRR